MPKNNIIIEKLIHEITRTTGTTTEQLRKYITKYPQTYHIILTKIVQYTKQNPKQALEIIKELTLPKHPNPKERIKREININKYRVLWESHDLGEYIFSVAWSPDGTKIAVGTSWGDLDHGKVIVFSSSGKKLWEKELSGYIYSVTFSPDSNKIAVGTSMNEIIIFSLSDKTLWKSEKLGSWIASVAWSPDGTKIAVGTSWGDLDHGKVIVFSSSGKKLWEKELSGTVWSVAWSPQGDKIVAGGDFRKVIVFSSSGKKLWEKELSGTVTSVAWSPNNKEVAAGIGWSEEIENKWVDHGIVVVFSPAGEKLWEKNLNGYVYSVAFSPDSSKIVVGGEFRKVIVFSSSGKKLWEKELSGYIYSVTFSPDSNKIAASVGSRIVVFSISPTTDANKNSDSMCNLDRCLDSLNADCFDGMSGLCGLFGSVVVGGCDVSGGGVVGEGLRLACVGDWSGFATALDVIREAGGVVGAELLDLVVTVLNPGIRDFLAEVKSLGRELGVGVSVDDFLDGVVDVLFGEGTLLEKGRRVRSLLDGVWGRLRKVESVYWGLDDEAKGLVRGFVSSLGEEFSVGGLLDAVSGGVSFARAISGGSLSVRASFEGFVEGVGYFREVGLRVCVEPAFPGEVSVVGAEVAGGEVWLPKDGYRIDSESGCAKVPLYVKAGAFGDVPVDLRVLVKGPGGWSGEFSVTAVLRVSPGSGGAVVGGGAAASSEVLASAGLGGSGFPDALRAFFVPLEFLGEGGFGRVWRVRRVSDGVVAALKVPVISSPELGRVFLREVSVWLGLRHENIVRLIDANVVPVPYLLMEYVPGATFKDRVVRTLEDLPKPVEPSFAVKLFEGVAAGVAYAHSRGVIHRDLKPLNVLLGEGLMPKISDWGLARLAVVTSRSVGLKAYSPAYAAPEQVDEEVFGGTDERTDIYQLGLILYELLTGHLPYEATTPAALVAKIANPGKPPKPPSAWDPSLKPFDAPLLKALAKRKDERYARVEDFVRDVRQALTAYTGGETLEEVRKEVEEIKRSMKRSIRAGRASEVRALKARYAEILGKYAVAALREGEVEEAIAGLEELLYYTRKHEEELATIIREVELVTKERGEAGEELIKRVRLITAKIAAEVRGGRA